MLSLLEVPVARLESNTRMWVVGALSMFSCIEGSKRKTQIIVVDW